MIGDWYHRVAEDVQASYVTHDSWGREVRSVTTRSRSLILIKIQPVPDSLLINGRGSFDCSMAVPSRPVDCVVVATPRLTLQHQRSRVRVINTG